MRHEGMVRALTTVVVALLVNLVLDVAFDLPMLVRWGIAVIVVLLVSFVVEVLRRRAVAQQSSRAAVDR